MYALWLTPSVGWPRKVCSWGCLRGTVLIVWRLRMCVFVCACGKLRDMWLQRTETQSQTERRAKNSVCERIRVSVIVSLRLTSSYGKESAITELRNPQYSVCCSNGRHKPGHYQYYRACVWVVTRGRMAVRATVLFLKCHRCHYSQSHTHTHKHTPKPAPTNNFTLIQFVWALWL